MTKEQKMKGLENIKDARQALKYAYINLPGMTDEAKPGMLDHIAKLEAHIKKLSAATKGGAA